MRPVVYMISGRPPEFSNTESCLQVTVQWRIQDLEGGCCCTVHSTLTHALPISLFPPFHLMVNKPEMSDCLLRRSLPPCSPTHWNDLKDLLTEPEIKSEGAAIRDMHASKGVSTRRRRGEGMQLP